jgi:hypothetical protein
VQRSGVLRRWVCDQLHIVSCGDERMDSGHGNRMADVYIVLSDTECGGYKQLLQRRAAEADRIERDGMGIIGHIRGVSGASGLVCERPDLRAVRGGNVWSRRIGD